MYFHDISFGAIGKIEITEFSKINIKLRICLCLTKYSLIIFRVAVILLIFSNVPFFFHKIDYYVVGII